MSLSATDGICWANLALSACAVCGTIGRCHRKAPEAPGLGEVDPAPKVAVWIFDKSCRLTHQIDSLATLCN